MDLHFCIRRRVTRVKYMMMMPMKMWRLRQSYFWMRAPSLLPRHQTTPTLSTTKTAPTVRRVAIVLVLLLLFTLMLLEAERNFSSSCIQFALQVTNGSTQYCIFYFVHSVVVLVVRLRKWDTNERVNLTFDSICKLMISEYKTKRRKKNVCEVERERERGPWSL